jgi:malonyl-CoA O-methyltransferase
MTPAAHPDFDRCAAHYENHAPVQREAAAWLAEWLPPKLEGATLELGAGTGLFTRHLVGSTDQLLVSDIAPQMVQAGRQTVPQAEWAVADATTPPAGRGYHWLVSCSLVQWLPDPLAAFRAWHRASAPGARLLAGWFVRGTLREFLAVCPDASPFQWRDAAEWLQILRSSGWTPVRHEQRTFTRRHSDAAAMLREIHNAGAVIPRRFGIGALRQALRHYDQRHRTENGVDSSFEFLRLEALRS